MKARGWTQGTLAKETGMLQPRISAILKPGKVRPNIETLRRIAEAFDCALLVRFAPFSELVQGSESFNPETFVVPSFDDDPGFAKEVLTEPVADTVLASAWSQFLSAGPVRFDSASVSDYREEFTPDELTTAFSTYHFLGRAIHSGRSAQPLKKQLINIIFTKARPDSPFQQPGLAIDRTIEAQELRIATNA